MERIQLKAVTGLLTKAAGLVFFAFLAISIGVVFGYLFEDWIKEEPGSSAVQAPVDSEVDLPLALDETSEIKEPNQQKTVSPQIPSSVRFKVRVGPYSVRDEALKAASTLESVGYPVYVSTSPPFTVQVGAFGSRINADRLKSELSGKGFTATVREE